MMRARHFVSIRDLSAADVEELFRLAKEMKRSPESYLDALRGKTLGMVFESPSTRTRVSFEVGIYQLGGQGLYLSGSDLQIGVGETVSDTARVLSRYVDAIVARVRSHSDVADMARSATVPVINGLSDLLHPCQALADYFTLGERKGDLKGRKVAYVGDGNHVCHSLLYGANKVGVDIVVASPKGHEPKNIIVKSAQREAKQSGTQITLVREPSVAVADADAVYTNRWTPIELEAESEQRKSAFQAYQVDIDLMSRAKPDAVFMHCLPAKREEEVTSEVLDGPQSMALDQVENRLHLQKAILYRLMKD
jgi:ornithine carbamoyltransferase